MDNFLNNSSIYLAKSSDNKNILEIFCMTEPCSSSTALKTLLTLSN